MTDEEYYRQYRSVSMGHPAATGDFADELPNTERRREWLRKMAELEDGCFVSVGGFICDIEQESNQESTEQE